MDTKDLSQINAILHRDSKDSTYRFALLRGLAEIAVEYDHLIRCSDDHVRLPVGLLVWKWILYYYPIVDKNLPQRNGEDPTNTKSAQISFRRSLKKITDYYSRRGGYDAFFNDLIQSRISTDVSRELIITLRQIRDTITDEPMRHMGYSISKKHFSIVSYNKDTRHIMEAIDPVKINPEFLIQNFGTFNIRKEFYEVLRTFGEYLTGTGSIINQWALFTSTANKSRPVDLNTALAVISTPLLNKHDTSLAQKIYENIVSHGVDLRCIWSGKSLDRNNLVIDHIIPFALIPNNDLWNLMPCHKTVNAKKSDLIPSSRMLNQRSTMLVSYWSVARDLHQALFDRQFKTSLVGFNVDKYEFGWANLGMAALKNRCNYYIEQHGVESWEI